MLTLKRPWLRRCLRWLIPLVLIPAVALGGTLALSEQRHILVSVAVALLSLLLFAAGYEKKQVGSRRLVITSILIALSVVGRLIPLFKPVTAVTVIAGVWLGGEAGFLVGSFSALLSNFMFGQGPWTPFQMLSWGIIGLLAGVLSAALKKSRPLLALYGAVSGLLFSLVMDLWTVLWYTELTSEAYLGAVLTALPHTLLYAASNVLFLWLMAKPFGSKLERIRLKYGV